MAEYLENNPDRGDEATIAAVKRKVNFLRDLADMDKAIEAMDKIGNFAAKLRENHSKEFDDCALYHVLAGSGIAPGRECTMLDFSGEDSVAAFIDRLEAEMSKEKR
ncbi:MAG: hypothetical protein PHS62_04440 [Patescibacteria group bacterium]|nr:hypothetical protein [Patescibacteria group bacterium]